MFSWGKSSSSMGSSFIDSSSIGSSSVISRSEHIESYINHPTLKPSTRRINRNDDSTYDTVFQTKSHNTLILRVHLSSKITNGTSKAPSMILVGAEVTHPWIDAKNRIIGFTPISSDHAWESSRMKLGEAVNQVVVHLQLNPPYVLEITDTHLKKMQPANASIGGGDAPPSYDSVTEPEPTIDFDFQIPDKFPALETMSRDEMSHLMNNKVAFDDFASIIPAKGVLEEFKFSITAENHSVAQQTLEQQEQFENLTKEVNAQSTLFQDKMKEHNDLVSQQQKLLEPTNVKEVKKKLNKVKKLAYDESENLANAWVDGDIDISVKDFVNAFLEKRMIYHERAAKIELLSNH